MDEMIVLINGSPRKENSSKIIDYAVSELEKCKDKEHKVINLSEKEINFCKHCDYCKTHNKCTIDDDCNSINSDLAKADGIVFVTPVYFGSMTGQLKTMLDRTLPLRRNGLKLKDKVGAVVAVGGSRNGGQEHTIADVGNAMHIQGMIVVGDDNHFGGIVHAPFEKDKIGKETVESTIQKVCRIVNKKCQQ